MTATAQNIALATYVGWRKLPDGKTWRLLDTDDYDCEDLPDYGSDLNAMAIAEAKLTGNIKTQFDNHIFSLCGSWSKAIHATATQRRECILKAIGAGQHHAGSIRS